MGSLLVPLGVPLGRAALGARRGEPPPPGSEDATQEKEEAVDVAAEMAVLGATDADEPEPPPGAGRSASLSLPFARRDLDRLRLILFAQRRLREVHRPGSVKHVLAGRAYFDDALRWMEIHGGAEGQELAVRWRSLDLGDVPPPGLQPDERASVPREGPPLRPGRPPSPPSSAAPA
jgi:hypothetical protein